MTEQASPSLTPKPKLTWQAIVDAGGIERWIDQELGRRGLLEPNTDPSKLSDAEKKGFKQRREEERRVRAELRKESWTAYRTAHLVHLGTGIFFNDKVDADRFDLADGATRRQQNEVPDIKDIPALATVLGTTIPRLRWFTFHRSVDSGTHYHRWHIAKRDGGKRLISAPKKDLKIIQRWIAHNITEHLPVHGAVHGFLAGRSTRSNAMAHAGAQVIIKLDIKDFYPSVTFPRVKGLFRNAGYGEQVATVLALLCTESPREPVVLRGKTHYVATGPRGLPQGAPTSPSITNTLCLKIDARLQGLAAKRGFVYSRYADDLTFSWRGKEDERRPSLGKFIHAVKEIVKAEGFTVHPDKTRIMRAGERQQITGLVVNPAKGRPPARVPRDTLRALRAAIKNRENGKPGKGESLTQLRGMVSYLHMTDPVKAHAFMERLRKLEEKGDKP